MKDISQLELLPESSLDPQFLEKTRHFCQHVLQSSPVKTVKGGHPVSGQSRLAIGWIDCKYPCMVLKKLPWKVVRSVSKDLPKDPTLVVS